LGTFVLRTRVLLVDLPPLVRDVVTHLLAGEDGVEVVDSLSSSDLESAVQRTSANVIVLPADESNLPAAGRRFLEERGNVRIVGLVDHARSGVVGHLTIQTGWLDDLSKASLVGAITDGRPGAAPTLPKKVPNGSSRHMFGLDS
jgi:DNA-binding NarL/FixJ family response regulator